MSLSRVTAPSSLFVLSEVKIALRVTHTDADNDADIGQIMSACEAWLDGPRGVMGRCLLSQTWEWSQDQPTGREVEIPLAPATAISAISYYDSDEANQSFSIDNVDLIAESGRCFVRLKPDVSWPSMANRRDALRVRITAGDASVSDLDARIVKVGHQWIAYRYRYRDGGNDASHEEAFEKRLMGDLSGIRIGWIG